MAWKKAKRISFPTPRPSQSRRAGMLAQPRRLSVNSQLSCRRARRKLPDVRNVVDRNDRRFDTALKLKGAQMRKVLIVSVILTLLFSITASAQNAERTNKLEPLPRELEIQLALSALPPHLRDNATVYVLNPDKGFEVARKGTNGFHALVARTADYSFRGTRPLK